MTAQQWVAVSVLFLAGAGAALGCNTFFQKQAVVVQPVLVPQYSTSYYDAQSSVIEELRREIAALKAQRVVVQQPESSDLATQAQAVLKKNCAECHTADSAKSEFKLFDANGVIHDVNRGLVYYKVHENEMPKGRPPLSAADKQVLLKWLGSK